MKSNEQFNGLNGVKNVTRNEIIEIIELAKQENNLSVIYRLSRILNSKPEADLFNIEIIEYPKTGLNGAQHTGDYKKALDDCGRLKKGYKFQGGKVVKVGEKPKAKPTKTSKSTIKVGKKPVVKKVAPTKTEKVAPVVDKSKFLGYDVENFDLKTAYDFFNKKLYNNELPKISLGYKAMKNKAGIAGAKVLKSGRNAKILSVDYIYLTSSYKFSNEQKLNTFIHEMIHVYLFSKGIWNTSGLDKSHGREFIAEKNRLDKILNTEIPISENIVDCEFKGNLKKVNVILIKSNLDNKYSIAVFDEKVEILDKEINLRKKLPNNTFYFLKTKSATANKYIIQRRKQNYYTYGTTEKDFNEILNDVSTINLIPESENAKAVRETLDKLFEPDKLLKEKRKNNSIPEKRNDNQLKLLAPKKQKTALKSPAVENNSVIENAVQKQLKKLGFVPANEVPEKADNLYHLPNEIGKFLQEQQPHKSLMLIKGNKHSSKSQLAMQIANSYAENGEQVAYIDYEQGGIECKDTVDSINRNTSEKGRKNISVIGYLEKPFEDLQNFCKICKIIVADSVTDLKITADQLNELRNKYTNVTWIFISQVKENGAMYGGNKMAHNPTVIINCTSAENPKDRVASLEKNRGNDLTLKYSIFDKKIIQPETEQQKQEVQPESIEFSFKVK